LGALLTKASEGGASYGYGRYGYGYGYGKGKLRHTEYLMIPHSGDDLSGAETEQGAGA
jgi:hypothetical protein